MSGFRRGCTKSACRTAAGNISCPGADDGGSSLRWNHTGLRALHPLSGGGFSYPRAGIPENCLAQCPFLWYHSYI
ncbi:MAG: hypothetical protein CW338_01085 [Clostridiales bacterium]|nr:hypothetical protein [Clostridiales bacterium]